MPECTPAHRARVITAHTDWRPSEPARFPGGGRHPARTLTASARASNVARPLLLVIDDEPVVLKLLDRLASRLGYEVVTFSGGVEALQALHRRPADLAMVDLRMPDANGLDLLRQIRSSFPACEVILMTGFAAVDSAVEAIKLGAREYLTKPFDLDRLREVLTEIRTELERRAQVMALESQVAK